MEKVKTSFKLNKDVHTELKVFCVRNNVDMSSIVEIALKVYLENIQNLKK